MGIADRIHDTIEDWQAEWKDRLRGWLLRSIAEGATKFIDNMEPEAISSMEGILNKIRDDPNTPDDIKALIAKVTTPGQPIPLLVLIPLAAIVFLPMLFSLSQPLGRIFMYQQDKLLHSFRLDPTTITSAWLRDKPGYEWLWQDLNDLGYGDKKIDVIKELAKIIPPLADMVRFADFSAFDPEVIEAWREFYDAPDWITEPMKLLGITNEAPRDWANKYWFSHWIQPGRYELGDMYRRGLMGEPLVGTGDYGAEEQEGEAEQTIKLAYRTMGYSAFWQDRLLHLVREIPTRVDVRRWWDMRTIDEEELRSIYQRQGYFGKDLDNYVRWTKVYVDFPVKMAHFKNGWITEDDVRDWLRGLEIPEDRIEDFIREKTKPLEPERVTKDRDLTMALIVEGVKKAVISGSEAIELLMDLGYNRDEADYILTVRVETVTGSPENVEEFRDITQKYRRAVGMPAKPVTEALKAAAAELTRVTAEVEALRQLQKEERDKLADDEVLPAEATVRLDEVTRSLLHAEAELFRVRTDYNALLAEWRHTEAE